MIAAIYARKSTEQHVGDEQKSVARQIAHAREYVDDGVSGAEFSQCPGYQRIMAAVKTRRAPFDVLIVSEQKSFGRETFETNYRIKQLAEAGVEVSAYLHDRSLTPKTWLDKAMSAMQAAADEAHREDTSKRTHEAHARLAQAGHCVGGRTFGYRNIDVFNGTDAHGRPLRSHVDWQTNEEEAAVIRRIFELRAAGLGQTKIAKLLNDERALSPRSQQGRPRAWAPTSVHEVLFREKYRGVFTWNTTRKRAPGWGHKRPTARPEEEWTGADRPDLQIVSDELWKAAHAQLDAARTLYRGRDEGPPWRPPRGSIRGTSCQASRDASSATAACTCGPLATAAGGPAGRGRDCPHTRASRARTTGR